MNNPYIPTPSALCAAAIEARKNSYSPYSGIRVGAALLTESGNVYTGCNIENSAYSPTVCAERVAVFKAISEGEKNFTAIAIAGGSGDEPSYEFPPCGVCRQVLSEFAGSELKVYLVKNENEFTTLTLADLLPNGFGKGNLK